MMQRYGRITGWGKYLPPKVLTNFDLEQIVDTTDEWIVSRTGIRQRRMVEDGETNSGMSVKSAQAALAKAQLDPNQLDLIIVATSSPDYFVPPVSSMVQHALGAKGVGAFTLVAGCTGFVYALATAQQFIAAGQADNVLVIGTEILTRNLNWRDRNTCVLFGDASAAVVVQASTEPTGVLSQVLGSDGSGAEALIVRGGGTTIPMSQRVVDEGLHHLEMDGPEVFKFATRTLSRAVRKAVSASGLSLDEINMIIPHQANMRIIELAATLLRLPVDRFYVNLDRYGNTSAASIPLALCEALDEGAVRDGDNLVLVGFGAGLTWAASVVRIGVVESVPTLTAPRMVPLSQFRGAAKRVAGRVLETAVPFVLPLYSRVLRIRKRKPLS
jgi:3-oxoacyl-[acyl-carrier-protein] synthase-3